MNAPKECKTEGRYAHLQSVLPEISSVRVQLEDEYMTFSQTAQRFPAFTEGSLRWHRFNDTGGFNRCVRRIGRKCVISLREFLHWIEEQSA